MTRFAAAYLGFVLLLLAASIALHPGTAPVVLISLSFATYAFAFECEGAAKPSCVAEVIFRSYE